MQDQERQRRIAELLKKTSVLAEMIGDATDRGALIRAADLRARVAELNLEMKREIIGSDASTRTATPSPGVIIS